MNNIQVLDCTLRDGGYCNGCKFGFKNTKKIVKGLVAANIDIIECGFLTNKVQYEQGITKYTTVEEIASVIPEERHGKSFVALMNYEEYNPVDLPEYDGTSVDGLRIAFHKKDRIKAMKICKAVQDKGYKVFVQPMISLSYTDEEFIDLIKMANKLKPYAFYIVDSFGMMKKNDLIRLFYLVDHNLKDSIKIGFHSHNNMQLAYSNAQNLVDVHTERLLIIDSSVYGMGRGAGNLNTELFVEYLNDNARGNYSIEPLLNIIDQILNGFYQKNYWGYSLPNYLSASHYAHPNYALYLDDKKTLTVEAMNEIFNMMDEEKKYSYDKAYIEKLYMEYMTKGKTQEKHLEELKNVLMGKKVILIAPGKSSADEKNTIIKAIEAGNTVTIGINSEYRYKETDYIFLSNLRRFRELEPGRISKCIVTSNIMADGAYLQAGYRELLNGEESVRDNAGLMAIKFLISQGVQEILLAGFDGYSHDVKENYIDNELAFITRNAVLDAMNAGMCKMLARYNVQVKIKFLTKPRNVILR